MNAQEKLLSNQISLIKRNLHKGGERAKLAKALEDKLVTIYGPFVRLAVKQHQPGGRGRMGRSVHSYVLKHELRNKKRTKARGSR